MRKVDSRDFLSWGAKVASRTPDPSSLGRPNPLGPNEQTPVGGPHEKSRLFQSPPLDARRNRANIVSVAGRVLRPRPSSSIGRGFSLPCDAGPVSRGGVDAPNASFRARSRGSSPWRLTARAAQGSRRGRGRATPTWPPPRAPRGLRRFAAAQAAPILAPAFSDVCQPRGPSALAPRYRASTVAPLILHTESTGAFPWNPRKQIWSSPRSRTGS
jgi:hypothetical protein